MTSPRSQIPGTPSTCGPIPMSASMNPWCPTIPRGPAAISGSGPEGAFTSTRTSTRTMANWSLSPMTLVPGLAGIFMADGTTLDTGANNLTLQIGNLGQSGNMVLENIIANDMLFRINGLGDGLSGSSILRASYDALISGNSLFIDHDPLGISSGGSVGTWMEPLLIQLNAIAAHTHSVSPGIFIDSPLQGLAVGGTFFGGFHLIQGLETVAGGDIFLNVNGTLTSAAGPLACGGSGGPICAGVGGDIILTADDVILNTVVNATVGDVTIRPYNLFQNILIGGAGGLNLFLAELQMIKAK